MAESVIIVRCRANHGVGLVIDMSREGARAIVKDFCKRARADHVTKFRCAEALEYSITPKGA